MEIPRILCISYFRRPAPDGLVTHRPDLLESFPGVGGHQGPLPRLGDCAFVKVPTCVATPPPLLSLLVFTGISVLDTVLF